MTNFTQLSIGWNAEPNAPVPQVSTFDGDVLLSFLMNPYQFPTYSDGDIGVIRFFECSRYRLGSVNDEGWYRGQCRFSRIAPKWGEFYQLTGDLRLELCPNDWISVLSARSDLSHFLFYFRDEEFECDATGWGLSIVPKNAQKA